MITPPVPNARPRLFIATQPPRLPFSLPRSLRALSSARMPRRYHTVAASLIFADKKYSL